jgi:hypothetical protein|tara:strand:+ start:597 stop:1205 length:609 start_codon:yes stop_codon:yes gene_type:complete
MGLFSKKTKPEEIKNTPFKIGDWVNSYSKGVFQIQEIVVEYFGESSPLLGQNTIGQQKEHRTIVSKRLLNSKFKKSLGYESCSELHVSHLNSSDKETLNQIIDKTPTLLEDLNIFQVPDIISIYNMPLQIDTIEELEKVKKLILFIQKGKTFLEIKQEMDVHDLIKLKPKNFGNYKFQIINVNNEYSNKRKVWRNAKLEKEE